MAGKKTDVIVNVEDRRRASSTVGVSTDFGANGFFRRSSLNLFDDLAGLCANSMSQRQQLVPIAFLNPRFLPRWRQRTRRTFTRSTRRFDLHALLPFGIRQELRDGSDRRSGIPSTSSDEQGRAKSSHFSAETNRRSAARSQYVFFPFSIRGRAGSYIRACDQELLIPYSPIRTSDWCPLYSTRARTASSSTDPRSHCEGEPGEPCAI